MKTNINNFKDYGFTADFEGEILKELDGTYLGYVVTKDNTPMCRWNEFGIECVNEESTGVSYNLIPIKPKVEYPIFKRDESGVYKYEKSGYITVVLHKDKSLIDKVIREPSNAENTPYNSERELYHDQPVWVHSPYETTVRFYNYTTDSIVDIENDEISIAGCKVEPISLDTLKTLPFIWGQYKSLKD